MVRGPCNIPSQSKSCWSDGEQSEYTIHHWKKRLLSVYRKNVLTGWGMATYRYCCYIYKNKLIFYVAVVWNWKIWQPPWLHIFQEIVVVTNQFVNRMCSTSASLHVVFGEKRRCCANPLETTNFIGRTEFSIPVANLWQTRQPIKILLLWCNLRYWQNAL